MWAEGVCVTGIHVNIGFGYNTKEALRSSRRGTDNFVMLRLDRSIHYGNRRGVAGWNPAWGVTENAEGGWS